MPRIAVLALDGVMDSSLALTLDAVAAADRLSADRAGGRGFEAVLFHPGRRRIRSGQGARHDVRPAIRIGRFDALIVPGLGLTTHDEVEAFFARRGTRAVVEWLGRTGRRAPWVAASCSAVFLLAEAGLLSGRPATTTWWLGPAFRERYPDVRLDETRMLVDAGGVITAGAALAQIDLMLHVISRAAGPALARRVARFLAVDERASQARYMMLSAVAGFGEEVCAVERWIRANLARRFSIAELARALGMSPRTLDRRVREATGHGASRLVQRLRLERAAHLIETTALSLDEIAGRVGYRDASTLRRLVRRDLDVSPKALRRRAS